MRLIHGTYNAAPTTVGDVLLNILNNFRFDQLVVHVIFYIIYNTPGCDTDKPVSDFEACDLSADQLKKLKHDYAAFQQQHRFKTIEEVMSSADETTQITPVKKVDAHFVFGVIFC